MSDLSEATGLSVMALRRFSSPDDGHTRGVRSGFTQGNRDFVVALLQFHAGDDRLTVHRAQRFAASYRSSDCCPIARSSGDGPSSGWSSESSVAGGRISSLSDLVSNVVVHGLTQIRLQRAWMLGSKVFRCGSARRTAFCTRSCVSARLRAHCGKRPRAQRLSGGIERSTRRLTASSSPLLNRSRSSIVLVIPTGRSGNPFSCIVVSHISPLVGANKLALALTIAGLLPPDFLPHLSKREVSGNRTQPWDCAVLMTWIALPKRPPIVPRRMPSIASIGTSIVGTLPK